MQFALINLAHTNRSPIRKEGAALRILGVFNNVDSLRKHTVQHYANSIDIICVPLAKWFAVFKETTSLRDEIKHVTHLYERYKEYLKTHEDEFQENYNQKQTGNLSKKNISVENPVEDNNDLIEPDSVPRNSELRSQSYAVISIMPDVSVTDTLKQEPAVLIWAVFPDEETAKKHIKDELSLKVRDVHLDIVLMYEWLPLTNLDFSSISEEYRDDRLSHLMSTRKLQATKVKGYRSQCEQAGQEPSIIEIGGESEQHSVANPLEDAKTLENLAPIS